MNACGLIVEYNPFHLGHLYHINQARLASNADCMIAVMSGSFLQRGEPAIIDKYHRTKAALASGVDIVLELPYIYSVQNSDHFAKGAVLTLNEIGVSSICFGSESGDISRFIKAQNEITKHRIEYNRILKVKLSAGLSFPEASKQAYREIGLDDLALNLNKPNNILGFSYVKAIYDNKLSIQPLTIERTKNNFHDIAISNPIASATSIRNELFHEGKITNKIAQTIPAVTIEQLEQYYHHASTWHHWESYFPYLQYRILTMSEDEVKAIHGVVEGLEYRIKKTAKDAHSFEEWVRLIKTKRYTWTRIQRMFVHLLTNTRKEDIEEWLAKPNVPYVRVLGFTEKGQAYLNQVKKNINVPLIDKFNKSNSPVLKLEEKATNAYYSILKPTNRIKLFKQELRSPIIL
ncbi:nucleotidyltransferase [Oceanobacillus piezotolerans]|uniref:tRNA(Met) cytidine acetate ligase n=1 Tax=Oceanobacillus piezotolerans TaxID=2448030 RepID=A0A498DBW2_9BACI|nr:nucleotidyltransferase [Oceanobacillus piezotolerans]RLL45223.1 nucleotidyltransferase [Oceanobacillus piezotolerans]